MVTKYIIYKVTNQLNGKYYIGKTTEGLKERKRRHKNEMNNGSNFYFHRALRKYGFENFKWDILDSNPDEKVLFQLERLYISKYESNNPEIGYNLTNGGEGFESGPNHPLWGRFGKDNPNYGSKRSSEFSKNMSKLKSGHPVSLETRDKISKNSAIKGIGHLKKSRLKMSEKSTKNSKYPGVTLKKDRNPEKKAWVSKIQYKFYTTILGHFIDPISASLVFILVRDEIYGEC